MSIDNASYVNRVKTELRISGDQDDSRISLIGEAVDSLNVSSGNRLSPPSPILIRKSSLVRSNFGTS